MCIKELRECPTCGWKRIWRWSKCITYFSDQIAACAQGERTYPHEECPNTKRYQMARPPWPLKCPPLQCGNPDCPDKARAGEVRRRIEEDRQTEMDIRELRVQLRKEIRERQAERFARENFVKQPVPNVEEQSRSEEGNTNAEEDLERSIELQRSGKQARNGGELHKRKSSSGHVKV